MKKFLIILFSLFLLVGCASTNSNNTTQEITGGWSEVADQALTQDLIDMFNKAVASTKLEGLTPVKLLATQVVNGTNYKFLCDNDKEVIIYQGLDGSCYPLNEDYSKVEKITDTANFVQDTLTGTIDKQYVIDTTEDFVLTLKDVKASLQDSVINVKNAKSVTIILEGENTLESTGDATTIDPKVISSDADLIIKGNGTLNIKSTATAIKSKANLTIEGGTYNFECGADGDGLRANNTLTIKDGTFNINAGECLEATYINIDGGNFNLTSTDDAINASNKLDETNTSIVPVFTMNNGNIVIKMNAGDTDGIDSNGDININGGTIDVTGQSGFDWDGNLTFNDGEVVVNGQAVKEIQNQMAKKVKA